MCFLLPLALATNSPSTFSSHLSYILTLYSLVFAFFSFDSTFLGHPRSLKNEEGQVIVFPKRATLSSLLFALLLLWQGGSITELTIGLAGLWFYVLVLPRLFTCFEKSFSFGEGCVALQAFVLYVIKSIIGVMKDEHDPTTVQGSFDIIANTGLQSLLILFTLPLVPGLGFINSSSMFYFIGNH